MTTAAIARVTTLQRFSEPPIVGGLPGVKYDAKPDPTPGPEGDYLSQFPVFQYFVRPCLAEFLGTLFFVLTTCLVRILVLPLDDVNGTQPLSALIIALTSGVTCGTLVGVFGHISGGHFNPVVSLGVWFGGGITFVLHVFYAISQYFGAFIGALLLRGMLSRTSYLKIFGGVVAIDLQHCTKGQAVLVEMVFTAAIVMTFLLTLVDTQGRYMSTPFLLGTIVTIATLVCIPITGAALNPARALGPIVVNSIFGGSRELWHYHFVYWVGPYLGAIIACLVYRFIFGDSRKRLMFTFKRTM